MHSASYSVFSMKNRKMHHAIGLRTINFAGHLVTHILMKQTWLVTQDISEVLASPHRPNTGK